jgi:hypothetical protein
MVWKYAPPSERELVAGGGEGAIYVTGDLDNVVYRIEARPRPK